MVDHILVRELMGSWVEVWVEWYWFWRRFPSFSLPAFRFWCIKPLHKTGVRIERTRKSSSLPLFFSTKIHNSPLWCNLTVDNFCKYSHGTFFFIVLAVEAPCINWSLIPFCFFLLACVGSFMFSSTNPTKKKSKKDFFFLYKFCVSYKIKLINGTNILYIKGNKHCLGKNWNLKQFET